MPADSKMDPSLAKAKSNSNGGSASVITYLRRRKKTPNKKNHQEQLQPERGVRICERNNYVDTKVSEEGGGGDAPGTGAEIPLQPMEKTMDKQAVSLQPMEVNSGADIYLQPMEDPTPEQVDAPERGCDPVGSPCWSRFAGRTCDPMGETPCWSSLFLKDCTLWKGHTLQQNCSLWEGLRLEKFMEDCLP
ncbi:AN1-type zinc finger protein 5-like [Grus japonensis]|uniref:AN1-type zinc finger protein 5-like n=1 Tax=Grus japonensis TaxID=30415 RepID=A0ABC9YHE7_GRUJA